MSNNPFAGKWNYQSYLNEASQPIFGQGVITFDDTPLGHLAGKLVMPGANNTTLTLTLRGNFQLGTPFAARFQGNGIAGTGTAGWIYNYIGYYIPAWPDGVKEVPAFVGSVIRTVAHGPTSPAGVVASFIAVRA